MSAGPEEGQKLFVVEVPFLLYPDLASEVLDLLDFLLAMRMAESLAVSAGAERLKALMTELYHFLSVPEKWLF